MSERLKRIFLIIGFVVIVGAMATTIYLLFFRPAIEGPTTVSPTAPTGETTQSGNLPSASEGQPITITTPLPGERDDDALPEADEVARGGVTVTTQLTTGRVEAPVISKDGERAQYYDPADGRFYRITEDGEVEALSNQRFPNVEEITWDRNAEKAVIEFPDGANIVYDFTSGTQTTLPAHWEDFDFSPQSDELAAKSIGIDPNNRGLIISNSDGSNAKSVANLGNNADKVDINWSPNNQVIAFSDTGPQVSGGLGRKMIIPLGKNNENYKGLVVEGLLFDGAWNNRGDKVVYSTVGALNDYRPLLWITDGAPNSLGENRRSLGVETWIDKCTFGRQDTLYCAVPDNIPPNAGLQRALSNNTPDTIYRIDLRSGTQELLAVPDSPTTYDQLQVSADEDILYLRDANTGALERIQLK